MEIFYIIVEVLKAVSISLGVGASTVVIALYLGSLSNDGKIDDSERRLLGINYTVLRAGMILIFLTHLILNIPMFLEGGITALYTPLNLIQWILLGILYVNAILMTAHIMPDTYGPGIQVSTWFSFGIATALAPLVAIDLTIFTGAYILFGIFTIWLLDIFKRDLKAIQDRKGFIH